MTAHRLLHEASGLHCYACGLFAETREGAAQFDCRPGGWAHPPYVLSDRTVETCADHPYAHCVIDARRMGNAHDDN